MQAYVVRTRSRLAKQLVPWAAWLVLCAVGIPCSAEERELEFMSLATHEGATCLDGSAAGYYYRAGRDAKNVHDGGWVLYLEDAGFCFTEAQCRDLSLTPLGSSLSWPKTREDPGGIMSKAPVEDPDMAHWHKVLLPSCDGSAFISNRTSPLQGGGSAVWFQGARILQSLIADLQARFSIKGRLLFAGSGSGGLGVMVHLDAVAAQFRALPDFKGDVIGLADSAFIPAAIAGARTHAVSLFTAASLLWEPVLPRNGCGGGAEGWECLFAERITAHLTTPLYVVQAAHDCVHMRMSLLPPDPPLHSLPPPGSAAPAPPPPSQLAPVGRELDLEAAKELWETAVREAIAPVLRSKRHGVYLNSCPARLQLLMNCGVAAERAEGTSIKKSPDTSLAPAGSDINVSFGSQSLVCSDCGGWRKHWVRVGCQLINVREAFGDWYFSYYWKGGDAEYAKVLDRVTGGMNPSCKYILEHAEQRGQPSPTNEPQVHVRHVDDVAFDGDEL